MTGLVARLIASGTPPELVEEVAMLVAEKRIAEQAIEQRRAKDRERQSRHRSADNVTSRDITGDSVTERDPSLSRPPNENNSNPPTHTHPNTKTPARGCRLPGAWEPKPLPADLAKSVAAWPAGAIERELARFRDWAASATGRVAVKKDWDAAWRNWLRKCEDEGNHRTNGTGFQRNGRSTGGSTADAAEIARANYGL